nr:hypothetical protein [Tanacetum cinerariifolium]
MLFIMLSWKLWQRSSTNVSTANKDKSPRINGGTGYDNQRIVNVAGARENVGIPVVQQSGIQCYNCKEYGNVARECQKPKWEKDAAYHKKKMLLYEHNVIIDSLDMSYDSEQVNQDDDDDLANERDLLASLIEKLKYMSYDSEQVNQDDDDDDLANERDLLASLIEKLKCEIDESKNRNKFLETSNKALVDKLKGEIKDFKTKNKSLESSNNHFKEANNELSKTNQLMLKDLKKFHA